MEANLMFEIAVQLQEALRQIDGKTEVFIHGGVFREAVRGGIAGGQPNTDVLIISRRLSREDAREAIGRLGGNPTHSCLYPTRQAFLRSRQFVLDQGALGPDGAVAFVTKQCLKDLHGRIARPTVWAKARDEAREGHHFSASVCGRAVRLSGQGFRPTPELAAYIRENWAGLLGSQRFRWQAAKQDRALRDPAVVPRPEFAV